MNTTTSQTLPVILLGAGGHGKVVLALAHAAGFTIKGVCDPLFTYQSPLLWRSIPVLGGDNALNEIDPTKFGLLNGIGQVGENTARHKLYDSLRKTGFKFPPLVHPSAWVAPGTYLGAGVQIMAGAIVQPDCWIGENTILNTRSGVDHDCRLGAHVHIAPGATLCGNVHVENKVFIGAGATVIQGIRIGESAVVGAGVTLVRDLDSACTVLGAPVRRRVASSSLL